MTADQARALGYCIVSRRHLLAARLDRVDWLAHLNGRIGRFKPGPMAASQYRRCHAKDCITVPRAWLAVLPNSDDPKAPSVFKEAAA